jgi:hypothetical protein
MCAGLAFHPVPSSFEFPHPRFFQVKGQLQEKLLPQSLVELLLVPPKKEYWKLKTHIDLAAQVLRFAFHSLLRSGSRKEHWKASRRETDLPNPIQVDDRFCYPVLNKNTEKRIQG